LVPEVTNRCADSKHNTLDHDWISARQEASHPDSYPSIVLESGVSNGNASIEDTSKREYKGQFGGCCSCTLDERIAIKHLEDHLQFSHPETPHMLSTAVLSMVSRISWVSYIVQPGLHLISLCLV
jgi:hypothetical protein